MEKKKEKFEDLEKIFYANPITKKVVEVLWWNWSNKCGSIELDVVCTDLSLNGAKEGHKLQEDKLLRVDRTLLFRDRKKAERHITPEIPQFEGTWEALDNLLT